MEGEAHIISSPKTLSLLVIEDTENYDTVVSDANSTTHSSNDANVNKAITNANDADTDTDQVRVQEEIERLNVMLKNNLYAYTVRMFYPIAV